MLLRSSVSLIATSYELLVGLRKGGCVCVFFVCPHHRRRFLACKEPISNRVHSSTRTKRNPTDDGKQEVYQKHRSHRCTGSSGGQVSTGIRSTSKVAGEDLLYPPSPEEEDNRDNPLTSFCRGRESTEFLRFPIPTFQSLPPIDPTTPELRAQAQAPVYNPRNNKSGLPSSLRDAQLPPHARETSPVHRFAGCEWEPVRTATRPEGEPRLL